MKKQVLLGMLTALVLGITVVGCGSKSNDILDAFDFSTAAPSSSALAAAGYITEVDFNLIMNTAGGGYYGWAFDNSGYLIMAWTGRSISDFNNVADVLDVIFGEIDRDHYDNYYNAFGWGYDLDFTTKNFSMMDYYISAGTMILTFD